MSSSWIFDPPPPASATRPVEKQRTEDMVRGETDWRARGGHRGRGRGRGEQRPGRVGGQGQPARTQSQGNYGQRMTPYGTYTGVDSTPVSLYPRQHFPQYPLPNNTNHLDSRRPVTYPSSSTSPSHNSLGYTLSSTAYSLPQHHSRPTPTTPSLSEKELRYMLEQQIKAKEVYVLCWTWVDIVCLFRGRGRFLQQ
jgi:hypothetical protein